MSTNVAQCVNDWVSGNPPEEVALTMLGAIEDDAGYVETLIIALRNDAYGARWLYLPQIKQRCALIALRDEALFKGVLTPAAECLLRYRINEWQRNILAIAEGGRDALSFMPAVMSFRELLTLDIPERKRYATWLPERGIVLVYGPRGAGKTMFMTGLSVGLPLGVSF